MTQEEILQVLGKTFNPLPWFFLLITFITSLQLIDAQAPTEDKFSYTAIAFLIAIIVCGLIREREK